MGIERDELGWTCSLCILLSVFQCFQVSGFEVWAKLWFVVLKVPGWRRESSTQPGAYFLTPPLLPERKTQGGKLETWPLGRFEDVKYIQYKRPFQIVQVFIYEFMIAWVSEIVFWNKTEQKPEQPPLIFPLRSMLMKNTKIFFNRKHTNRRVVKIHSWILHP